MHESQTGGVEEGAVENDGAASTAVGGVTHDRVSGCFEVHPDLVSAASLETATDQRDLGTPEAFEHLEVGAGRATTGDHGHLHRIAGITPDRRVDLAGLQRDGQRLVSSLTRMVGERRVRVDGLARGLGDPRRLIEDRQHGVAEMDGVWFLVLHALSRHRPDPLVPVDLGPCRTARFAAARHGEDHKSEAQRGHGIALGEPRHEFRHLGKVHTRMMSALEALPWRQNMGEIAPETGRVRLVLRDEAVDAGRIEYILYAATDPGCRLGLCCPDRTQDGVDINRNYDFLWGACNGSSGSCSSDTYRGASAAAADVLSGQIPLVIANIDSLMGQVSSGKLKAIATTGAQRAAVAPNVPTFAEAVLPELVVTSWSIWAVPAGTPPRIKEKLRAATERALKAPEVIDSMRQGGFEPGSMAVADAEAFIKTEQKRWGEVIRAAGIKPQ